MTGTKTLYLISAEKAAESFWKIGSSKHEDPLKEDPKHFLECFRKELVGASAAKELKRAINHNINYLIADCLSDGYKMSQPSEGISYELPLKVLEDIYDFWFAIYKEPELWEKCIGLLNFRGKISFTHPAMVKGLIGSTSDWASKIEELHSYRPSLSTKTTKRKNPMWV